MNTNTQLLDEAIAKSGLKIAFICEQLGISPQAFAKKRINKIKFRTAEVYVLRSLLRISDEDKDKYFYVKKV